MEAIELEIRKFGIETITVQADFAGNANLDFYRGIHKKVEGLDFGLIVLNAGCGSPGAFENNDGV